MIGLNMSHDRMVLNFQNCLHCEKDLKDNKHNRLYLGQKYAGIFVLGHYLFCTVLRSRKTVLRTDNVHGQISLQIFAPNF